MNRFDQSSPTTGMWRVVFYERRANRVRLDRSGPWLTSKQLARQWASWFGERGYHVALQDQSGELERLTAGLPG